MFACKYHWKKIPKRLRDKIWSAYQPGQEDPSSPVAVSAKYLEVAREFQEWAKAQLR